MLHRVTMQIKDNELILETGHLAKQANGAVLATFNGTTVLATVCATSEPNATLDYFPLQVTYNEKYYAAGKIPGGFIKREGRPRDKEVLISRLIDRPIRPLFAEGFRNEIQILPTTISADQQNPPDILAIIASSAALCVSDIPFNGPVGACRIGKIGNDLIINPTFEEMEQSSIELVVAGTDDGITMIEGSAKEVVEADIIEALHFAYRHIVDVIKVQKEFVELVKPTKMNFDVVVKNKDLEKDIRDKYTKTISDNMLIKIKKEREGAAAKLKKAITEEYKEKYSEEDLSQLALIIDDIEYENLRDLILIKKQRTDGRGFDQLRNISCEIGILPRTHGSAIFTRGETQSLGVITLGTQLDEQRLDDIEGENVKAFMLHYNFPPFSVGEVGRIGSPSRREIGHGNLAERSITPILPDKDKFPYTVRIVSEILESNGSSSMATVCSSILGLLDAGVPISKIVAGIAMGVIINHETKDYQVLTDIQGVEDHLGDMDFKVAGTRDGITAFQLDIKVNAISIDIMTSALEQAKKARVEIIEKMEAVIPEPKTELSPYAPKIITFMVNQDKIREIIGPGGAVIKKMTEITGATIFINDLGQVTITSKDEKKAKEAYNMIRNIVADAEVGKIYKGKVTRMVDFGAFVEILPGKEGLCHISNLADRHVRNPDEVVSEGQLVSVKVIGIDKQGRIDLSMKPSDLSSDGVPNRPNRDDRNSRGNDRRNDRNQSDRNRRR